MIIIIFLDYGNRWWGDWGDWGHFGKVSHNRPFVEKFPKMTPPTPITPLVLKNELKIQSYLYFSNSLFL